MLSLRRNLRRVPRTNLNPAHHEPSQAPQPLAPSQLAPAPGTTLRFNSKFGPEGIPSASHATIDKVLLSLPTPSEGATVTTQAGTECWLQLAAGNGRTEVVSFMQRST
jgi:hypothetical protein